MCLCLDDVVEDVLMDILDFLWKAGIFPASVGWEPEPEGALGISAVWRKEGQDSQLLTVQTICAIFVLFFPICLYFRCASGSLNLPETLHKGIVFLSSVCNECKISEAAAGGGEAHTHILANHFAYCCRQTSPCFLRLWNGEWSGMFLKALRETLDFHIMMFCWGRMNPFHWLTFIVSQLPQCIVKWTGLMRSLMFNSLLKRSAGQGPDTELTPALVAFSR